MDNIEETVLRSVNHLHSSTECFRPQEKGFKQEPENAILGDLTHPPLWKYNIFVQVGKWYTIPINWIWDGRSIGLWQYKIKSTVDSGILYGCHLVPQLWPPPAQTFLMLPFAPAAVPCPGQHAFPFSFQGMVVDCADSCTLRFLGRSASPPGSQSYDDKVRKANEMSQELNVQTQHSNPPRSALLIPCSTGT